MDRGPRITFSASFSRCSDRKKEQWCPNLSKKKNNNNLPQLKTLSKTKNRSGNKQSFSAKKVPSARTVRTKIHATKRERSREAPLHSRFSLPFLPHLRFLPRSSDPFRQSLGRRGCDSHLFHAFCCSPRLCWPEIGSWAFFSLGAGSWSRQTRSRLTSSPRRFPRRSAVCVNTLFLPSSLSRPTRCRRHTWRRRASVN